MTSDLIHLEFACPARTPLSLRLKDISNLLPFNQFTFSIFRTHRKLGNAAERQAQPSPQPVSTRSEEHTSELQSRLHLVCRLLLEKKKTHSSHYKCSDIQQA